MKRLAVLIVSLVYPVCAWADTAPRYIAIPSIGWSLDRVVDLTSAGTITGTTVAMTSNICSGTDKLTTDSAGNVICAADQAGGGSSHALLSATHSDSVVNTVSRGSLIYGNATPAWDELTVGGANTVLTANGTDAAWSASPTVTNLTSTATITGAIVDISTSDIRLSALVCSSLANGGKLSLDSKGVVKCFDDISGSGSGVTSISQGTNMSFSVDPITSTGTINLAASPSVTNLTATSTVTGLVVSATGNLQVGATSLNDITGRSLSVVGQALDADAELYTVKFSASLEVPTASDDNVIQIEPPGAFTVTEVACTTDVGTATINVDERTNTTPDSAGTNVLSADLVCDTNRQSSCASGCDVNTINNASIASGSVMSMTVTSVATAPTKVRLFIKGTMDD